MKESTARIGDGRTDGRTLTTGLEVNAFRAVGRKSTRDRGSEYLRLRNNLSTKTRSR